MVWPKYLQVIKIFLASNYNMKNVYSQYFTSGLTLVCGESWGRDKPIPKCLPVLEKLGNRSHQTSQGHFNFLLFRAHCSLWAILFGVKLAF